ncbi:hypothetical protein AAE478_002183 [Parahypoxylon ruwenzoriense]
MRLQTTAFIVAGLAASAQAQNLLSDINNIVNGSSCVSSLGSLDKNLPTPANSDLVTFFQTYWASHTALETDSCAIMSALPTSLTSAAASYESQLSSYASAHASVVASVVSACITGFPSSIQSAITSAAAEYTGYTVTPCFPAASGTGSGTGTGVQGAAETASTVSPNAALPRPTGVVAGAAAVAGFIGAVALL